MQDNPLEIIEITKRTRIKQRIRSGSDQQRKQVTLSIGEMGYTTDSKRVFVGDGQTTGGIPVSLQFHKTQFLSQLSSYEVGDMVSYYGNGEGYGVGVYIVNESKEMDPITEVITLNPDTVLNLIYPVGSVMFRQDELTPTDLGIPGTWTQIAQGTYIIQQDNTTFIAGRSGGQNSFNLVPENIPYLSTGSSNSMKTISLNPTYQFKNDEEEIPANHIDVLANYNQQLSTYFTANESEHYHSVGGINLSTTINIQPAYISLQMWQRTGL